MAGDAAARGPHRSLVQDVMHVVERFAAWANDWRSKPIAPEVLHHAKRAVIDWHAALFPGAVMPPATLLDKALGDELDKGDATLALGRRAPVRAAAPMRWRRGPGFAPDCGRPSAWTRCPSRCTPGVPPRPA